MIFHAVRRLKFVELPTSPTFFRTSSPTSGGPLAPSGSLLFCLPVVVVIAGNLTCQNPYYDSVQESFAKPAGAPSIHLT